MKQPHFSHVDANSQNMKVDQKFLVGHGQKWVWPICSRTVKLTTSQEFLDGINRFFASW